MGSKRRALAVRGMRVVKYCHSVVNIGHHGNAWLHTVLLVGTCVFAYRPHISLSIHMGDNNNNTVLFLEKVFV